jgi:hypothetical protein
MESKGTNILSTLVDTVPDILVPDKTNLELECRFSIDERKQEFTKSKRYSASDSIKIAKAIIKDTSEYKHELDQSINFIRESGGIKQVPFVDGEQKKDKHFHYVKTPLINPLIVSDNDNEFPTYKITLSFERQIEEFSIKDCQSARIRLRYSIYAGQWRFDITLLRYIKSLTNPQELKSAKQEMIYAISIKDFTEKAPWEIADVLEFEMEYIDKPELLTTDSIKFANDFINPFISGLYEKEESAGDYQGKLYDIAKWIKPNQAERFKNQFGMKQLGNQPIELDKNIYTRNLQQRITEYYITDKVDGKRAILFIDVGKIYALTNELKMLSIDSKDTGKGTSKNINDDTKGNINDDNNVNTKSTSKDKTKGKPTSLQHTYIFDCEEYNNIYYIFDVMVWMDQPLLSQPFHERIKHFTQATELLNNILFEKPFVRLTSDYSKQIKELKARKREYETDGFILTPADGLYNDMRVYKYKPLNKLSVDFLIKKCPQKLLGIKPYLNNSSNLYILFCGINRNVYMKLHMELIKHYEDIFDHINSRYLPDYFPIQFEPSNKKYAYLYWDKNPNLDDNVGEFIYHTNTKEWKLIKIRDDRKIEVSRGNYFGNNYRFAEATWFSYDNPLIIESDEAPSDYFQTHESELHRASRSFNRYVVSEIFKQYRNLPWALDLASGKGQDLFRYAMNGIGKDGGVLFLEIDKTAIQELINRKHEFSSERDQSKRHQAMKVFAHQMDLSVAYKDNISTLQATNLQLPNTGFDIIVCNFAFHYLVKTYGMLINIMRFINYYLKPGGRFVFTAFDGEAITDLLKLNKGEWNSSMPGKFSIKKSYAGDALLPIGQKIKVLLPFSKGEYYDEYLINITYIETEFKKVGLSLETNQSFGEFLPGYKGANQLDTDDKTYTSLYHYYSFYKNKSQLKDK